MQYFEAVRRGEVVAARAQGLLASYTGYAVAAMIVKEGSDGWMPVGEESLVAVVRKDENFCVLVVCDSDGYVKAMSGSLPCRVAESIASKMMKEGFGKYEGRLVLPV